MERLPLEMLLMIFKNIDFINLIKLRSICKYWKSIIDNNKIIKKLFIGDIYCKFKYLDNNSIIFLDQFKLPGYQIFEKIIRSNIILNLKYLNYSLECNNENENKLICLNRFKSLEHLVLDIELISEYQDFILDHQNIKCLSIKVWYYDNDDDGFRIKINCPKCENLRFGDSLRLSNCDIIYPERIKILKLDIMDLNKNKHEIDKFINIEQLEIKIEYLLSNYAISSKISKFSKLKKIAVRLNYDLRRVEYFKMESIRNLLYDVIDQNQISAKQIDIFFNGKEIESKKQIKKLIDNEIGESLDLQVWKKSHNPRDSNYLHDLMEFEKNLTDSDCE